MNTPTPQKAANQLSYLLNLSYGEEHFPVKIQDIAVQYSKDICPNKNNCANCEDKDCLCAIKGLELSNKFDGQLQKTPQGWVIIYNKAISYPGRINFTLAHEFGHYILHRKKYPNGLKCDKDAINKDENIKSIENEANTFASYLLMPLDDFRKSAEKYTFSPELFYALSERYNTSLTATVLKWIEMTDKEAMAVSSDNGFVLWKRQSKPLLKKNLFRCKKGNCEEFPFNSLSSRVFKGETKKYEPDQKDIWGKGLKSEEIIFNAPHLEAAITVVLFKDLETIFEDADDDEDCFDRFSKSL